MSLVRSRGNKTTELRLLSLMRAGGVTGWRRNQKLPGRPDFLFRKQKLAIFVDGCFWHGCNKCSRSVRMPATNRPFWLEKIWRNRGRDRKVGIFLRKAGWRVLRIWEHELKDPERCLKKVLRYVSPPNKAKERISARA